jgi:hypothetical protein
MNQPSPRPIRHFLLLLPLAVAPLLSTSCAKVAETNESLYDKVFERSRQRRIAKDTANLKAGRPLQYYHSARELHEAKRTGRD